MGAISLRSPVPCGNETVHGKHAYTTAGALGETRLCLGFSLADKAATLKTAPMTAAQRVEAQHWLKGFDHQVSTLSAELSPSTGHAILTRGQFDAGVDELIGILRRIRRQFGTGEGSG